MRDIQLPEVLDDRDAGGAFAGLGDATIDLGKGVRRLDGKTRRGLVEDGLERADVAGGGVLDHTGGAKPLLVGLDKGCGELTQGEVCPTLRPEEADKAVAGTLYPGGLPKSLGLTE